MTRRLIPDRDLLDVVDRHQVDRAFLRYQLEAELLLKGVAGMAGSKIWAPSAGEERDHAFNTHKQSQSPSFLRANGRANAAGGLWAVVAAALR
jgi:hypothetical protein